MKSRVGDILFRSFSAKLNLSFSLNGNFSKSSRPHFVFIPKLLVGGGGRVGLENCTLSQEFRLRMKMGGRPAEAGG